MNLSSTAKYSEIKAKNRLLELDAFRGIAAVLVVLFHFTYSNDFGGIFKFGVTGVDLFFIISGFVIFLTLEKVATWRQFAVNRLSRLLPTYWTCVTITFLVKISFEHLGFVAMLSAYFANLTMFQLNVFKIQDIDGSYWTMTVEMIFYIFMLLIFQFKFLKYITWIGLITTVLCFIYGTFLKLHYPQIHSSLGSHLPLINHFPLFFAGILFLQNEV